MQCLVMLAAAFGDVDDLASPSSSLDFLCSKLRERQELGPLRMSSDLLLQVSNVGAGKGGKAGELGGKRGRGHPCLQHLCWILCWVIRQVRINYYC